MTDKQNGASEQPPEKTKKIKGRPNKILIGIIVILIWVAMWATGKKQRRKPVESAPINEIAETLSLEDTIAQKLRKSGTIIGIGDNTLKLTAEGSRIVGVETIPGLTAALEGQDVDAVIHLLTRNKVKKLVVDPSIARRNPMPKISVKNRLALGRPVGRLSATLMTMELFVYELTTPFSISNSAMQLLTKIARDGMAGRPFTVPPDAPALKKSPSIWTMIMTVRKVQDSHLSYHSKAGDNPYAVAYKLGEKGRKYYKRKKRFIEKIGALDDVFDKKLTLDLEVFYDEGTFMGPKENLFMWRIIEPGIHGIRMNVDGRIHYLPPWYSVATNMRTVKSLFERVSSRLAKKKKDYWLRPDVAFDRFRTIHWHETRPGGPIQALYRFSPRVPSTKDVTKENMIKAVQGLGDWIGDNVKPDGRYVYRYFPTKDAENDEYNMVRHCLGPFSMALTHEWAPNPKYQKEADLGMDYIEKHIRWGGPPRKGDGTIDKELNSWMGKDLPGDDVAIIEFAEPPRGDWSSKMGAVAVSILGYTQYKRVGWKLDPEREKVLKGLSNFLLYMHNEKAGNFHHYYVAPQNHYYDTRNSIYPGEILYAVARLFGETKDERFKKVFNESLEANLKWFKDQMAKRLPDGTYEEKHRKNLVQFQPWMAMAMDEMYRYDPDPRYVEASNLVSLWILDTYQFDENRAFFPDYLGGYMKVMDELPAMHTFVYTEGVAASYDLAKRSGADPEIIEKLRKGALISARFLMQQQIRLGENDFFYPNPKKAKGAVKYCMNHNKQRIDYTYHALSSVYRILHAATPEDYAYVQSIPMPKAW